MDASLADQSAGDRRKSTRLQRMSSSSRSNSLDLSAGTTPPIKSSQSTPVSNVAPSMPDEEKHDSSASKRSGLRQKRKVSNISSPDHTLEDAMKAMTKEERQNWQGWAELESDPALFQFILREYGVTNVKVQEMFSIDRAMVDELPKPVFGMIFLFEYREEDEADAEEVAKCPKHVWFANQTITNACATLALLNIVMNVPEINLGDNLTSFKMETQRLKPAYRGQTLGQNDFIRNIHNSFARRMEILNADLALSNEVEKWGRAKKNPRKNVGKSKAKKADGDSTYHYVAYVPIKGVVWRLDGLQREPVNLGDCEQDWMELACANIQQQIARGEGLLQFNLLSLCRSPLSTIAESLAQNMHSIASVEEKLSASLPDWKQFIEGSESRLESQSLEAFGLSRDLMDKSAIPESALQLLNEASTDSGQLISLYQEWAHQERKLQSSYVKEVDSVANKNEQAARRKHDYTPLIYNAIKKLAEEGVLKEIIRNVRAKKDATK